MMTDGWLPTALLLGAAVAGSVFAFIYLRVLSNEVERNFRASDRDQAELFEYLRQAKIIFTEYFAKQQKEDA
jgi:hypothetical protein